jgi:uncharacterized protein (TIGR00369 family)
MTAHTARTVLAAAETPGIRTRSFSWSDPAALAAETQRRSGLDYLRAIASGELPPPPVAELLGTEIVEVEAGRVVFALEPAEWMYNPIGSVHGGIAATLLDTCMGCALHSTLEAGVGWATSDLQVRYIRPMTLETGRVLGEGRVVHAGRRSATAEGYMRSERDGALLAHATCGCAIIDTRQASRPLTREPPQAPE